MAANFSISHYSQQTAGFRKTLSHGFHDTDDLTTMYGRFGILQSHIRSCKVSCSFLLFILVKWWSNESLASVQSNDVVFNSTKHKHTLMGDYAQPKNKTAMWNPQ